MLRAYGTDLHFRDGLNFSSYPPQCHRSLTPPPGAPEDRNWPSLLGDIFFFTKTWISRCCRYCIKWVLTCRPN